MKRLGLASCILAFSIAPLAADAQTHPHAADWRRAEDLVRQHYAAAHRDVVEVRQRRDRGLGTTFWVRFANPVGGNIVFVRGTDVIDAHGDASVSRILNADDFLARREWTAGDLLFLLQSLDATMPSLGRAPITDINAAPMLRPRLEYSPTGARLTIYAFAPGPPEAPPHPEYYVTRAVLTIDAHGALAWSPVEHVVLDARPAHRGE